jgi:acyl-[acyl carrier protein]--UDP-N-acetylglucosamine O-acyltransferase
MFFAPMSAGGMNKDRERVYHRAKARGYQCINYISSYATVMGEVAGDNCFILEDNTIQPFTKVGSNVVLWSGNHIGHHGVIGDHVTVTSHVVISGHCTLGQYSFIGVNATLRDNISVAMSSLEINM